MRTVTQRRRQAQETMPEVRFITSMAAIPENVSFVLVMFGVYGQQTSHSRGLTLLVPRTHHAAIDELALQHTIDAAKLAAERNGIDWIFVYE